MDSSEIEVLVQRLVANPHDQEALAYAHDAGSADPKSYAVFLEKVGNATADPAYASHWLSEAANVWSITLGDAHRAARILMSAVDKDPTQETPAERLAQLYREKGEHKALLALLERRAKALTPLIHQNPDLRLHLAGIHEELGRVWSEPPLSVAKRGVENYRRAIDLDPTSAYAVYALRELYKGAEQWQDALPLFAMEQAIVTDPERKLALLRDEAQVRKVAGDPQGATHVLRQARALAQDDAVVVQELGASILERIQSGEAVSAAERQEAAEAFALLAQSYEGEHGLAYALAGLDAQPGDDRSMQLAAHHAEALGRAGELAPRWAEYLRVNPSGAMARDARRAVGSVEEAPASVKPPLSRASSGRPANSAPPAPLVLEDSMSVLEAAPPAHATAQILRALEEAAALAGRGQRPQALQKYKEVLAIDPAHPEALAWVEDYLRHKRQYAELRDVLMHAARSPSASSETRKQQLLEVAGICETQLRDLETAIVAWKQVCTIDRGDASARDHLRRLLERGGRWDELASVLEQEATVAADLEAKVALEKKLAQLHEVKRKDLVSAGEAWARIATMLSGDELPIHTAVKLFDRAQRRDLACQVLAANAGAIEDRSSRGALYFRLGELFEKSDKPAEAGEAYVQAAESDSNPKTWEAAERCLVAAEQWNRGAYAVTQRAELIDEPKQRGALFMRAADLLSRGGDEVNALLCIEGASSLDPGNDEYAKEIEARYTSAQRFADLAEFYGARAGKLEDGGRRATLRKEAAALLSERLNDGEAAREMLLRALEDGDDADVLLRLADDSEKRGDPEQARDFLKRLVSVTKMPADRVSFALREAKLLADALGDPEGAIARYSWILDEVDSKNREAVQRIAELEEKQKNPRGVADALERELRLVDEPDDKLDIARRLAPIYEGELDEPEGAVRALNLVHELDPEDYEATARLEVLCEKLEDWPRVASLLQALAEIEGDDAELSALSRRLASVLADKLGRGDDALAALLGSADSGDQPCREAYVELGDRLGWKGLVAGKLVEWYANAAPSATRNESLKGAFDRFIEVGREQDATSVGAELARSRAADKALADKLEELAVKLKDLEALAAAHEVLAKELTGEARAAELVRQAEILLRAGVDPVEAQQHGEAGLGSVPPSNAEPLLARLAQVTAAPGSVVDVYERQVSRSKAPPDRLAALARAAQVAVAQGASDRAKGFYDLALSVGNAEETSAALESSAAEGDRATGGTVLRATLAEAFSQGGHGARDGGRTRALLLRRAAEIARRDLADVSRAFQWLGDALIAHVDAPSLDALEALGTEAGDLTRAEATLGRALSEVYDGPLVRQILARRIRLRRDRLGDKSGAVEDLKKLHDLSPADVAVMDELSQLLTELGDFQGMVHVLEDQILRSKDPQARAELARKVARLWEDKLQDPREAADAWRRVLRMRQGDTDAQAGLERAKAAMLKHPSGDRLSTPMPEPAVAKPPPPRENPPVVERAAPPPEPAIPAVPPSAPAVAAVATNGEAGEASHIQESTDDRPHGDESLNGEAVGASADDLVEEVDASELVEEIEPEPELEAVDEEGEEELSAAAPDMTVVPDPEPEPMAPQDEGAAESTVRGATEAPAKGKKRRRS